MEELRIKAKDETLDDVLRFVSRHLEKCRCDRDTRVLLLVAVEEVFVNIAHYAYGKRGGEAVIQAEATEDSLRLCVRDRGKPYDPLQRKDPDITLSAEDRKIGGLGVYFVKKTMDRVRYQRERGWNVLTMEKDF